MLTLFHAKLLPVNAVSAQQSHLFAWRPRLQLQGLSKLLPCIPNVQDTASQGKPRSNWCKRPEVWVLFLTSPCKIFHELLESTLKIKDPKRVQWIVNSNLELDISFHGTLTQSLSHLSRDTSTRICAAARGASSATKPTEAVEISEIATCSGWRVSPTHLQLDEGKTFRWNSLGRIDCKNPLLITAATPLPEMGLKPRLTLKLSGEILADVVGKMDWNKLLDLRWIKGCLSL